VDNDSVYHPTISRTRPTGEMPAAVSCWVVANLAPSYLLLVVSRQLGLAQESDQGALLLRQRGQIQPSLPGDGRICLR
jgi:hypothetical protein